ncbi:MAG: hypothetical protein R3E77_14955 [Steroidobacteraceae bacterium]
MGSFKDFFYRPPWVGLIAFLIVFLVQGLGHAQMTIMEHIWPGPNYVLQTAFGLGLFGAVFLWWGMRRKNEVAATWIGFWAGTCLWTGWVEFSYVWAADYLGVKDLMDPYHPGEIATKNEYLVMMSSVGVLAATLTYFLFNKETKCNFFLWLQRNLGLKTGKPNPSHERNFAAITALETIYVIWFFYVLLLFIYDESILGDRHPVTYVLFFLNVIWAVYLIQRLLRFWRVTTAIRYAIPTAIISWNVEEIMGRWNLYKDFWVHPGEYWFEITLVTVGIAIAAVLAILTPAHKKAELSRQQLDRGKPSQPNNAPG